MNREWRIIHPPEGEKVTGKKMYQYMSAPVDIKAGPDQCLSGLA
jgi:hypothetical protein